MRSETKKESAKRRKGIGNLPKHRIKFFYKPMPTRTVRRKSIGGKKSSSTKTGRGSALHKAVTIARRIMGHN